MPVYLSPGVYVEQFLEPRAAPADRWVPDCGQVAGDVPAIELAGPGAAVFLGCTQRIPAGRDGTPMRGRPVPIGSWDEFVEQFGGLTGNAHLPAAVHGYFANSGARAYVLSLKAADEPEPSAVREVVARFTGDREARTGLAALDDVGDVGMVCAPDLLASASGPDGPSQSIAACREAMIAFCEWNNRAIAILDVPRDCTGVERVRQWRETAVRDSSHAAVYYPWIHPGSAAAGEHAVPPCGHVAGAYVRSYLSRGAHSAPANESLEDAAGVEVRITQSEQDHLNPIGVNVLRLASDGRVRIWGSRTLQREGEYRSVHVRRFISALGRSIQQGTEWVLFQNFNAALRARLGCAVYGLLTRLRQSGAFAGGTDEEAFYLREEPRANAARPPALEIGVALGRAGRFSTIRVVYVSEQTAGDDDEPAGPDLPGARPEPVASGAPRIFVSYGREDWDEFVRPLVDQLRAAGFQVWVDQHLLRGGQDWMDQINAALETCTVMLLCVSPDSMDSKHVKLEYRYFFGEDKPIVPVICRGVRLPAELRGVQHIDYADHASVIARLRELLP